MHILLIHQVFTTGSEPGGTRHYELGNLLTMEGHSLTVVASSVNYLTRCDVSKNNEPSGPQHSKMDRLYVRNAWAYRSATRGGGFSSRLFGFLTFMVSSFIQGMRVQNIDVVWGTSPPIFQALTAYIISRWKKVPFVLEVRDLWPDFAVSTGVLQNRMFICLGRWLERFLYRKADRVIVNSPGFIEHLVSNGVPGFLLDVVPNGVDVSALENGDGGSVRDELGLIDKFVVMYTGAHGLANDLETVLAAAGLLREYTTIVFVLVGDGTQRKNLIQKAKCDRLDNVLFVDAQPKNRMPEILAAADVCLAILKAVPMFDTTYPNKVFDYMAAGRPTILAIDGVIRCVVEEGDAGYFVQPGASPPLAEAVLKYYQDVELRQRQGENAHKHVAAHFDRKTQAIDIEKVLRRAAQDRVMKGFIGSMYKRGLDLILSLIALIVLTLPFLVVALAIKINSRGPVFFRQERVGRNGLLFKPWKFRTMVERAATMGLGTNVEQNDTRITGVGRVLRDFSIDELPQLLNVVKGEMSLVGPRPTLLYQTERYDENQQRRLLIKPGITGLAAVNGRNALLWEDRIKMDCWYLDHWSPWLDIKILAATPWKVLVSRQGLYGEGGVNDDFGGDHSRPSSDDRTISN